MYKHAKKKLVFWASLYKGYESLNPGKLVADWNGMIGYNSMQGICFVVLAVGTRAGLYIFLVLASTCLWGGKPSLPLLFLLHSLLRISYTLFLINKAFYSSKSNE